MRNVLPQTLNTESRMPSTRDLSGLPAPDRLRDVLQLSAMLDVVLCEKDWLRCYTFRPNWSDGVSLATYNNGGGNDMFVFFRGEDAIIKGFDHESPVSPYARDDEDVWPGIYDGVPMALGALLDDEAVQRDDVTFCVWHTLGTWRCGSMSFPAGEDDGSSYLLGTIYLDAASYVNWARDYYERAIENSAIEAVYAGQPIDAELIAAINPDRNVAAALAELSPIADA